MSLLLLLDVIEIQEDLEWRVRCRENYCSAPMTISDETELKRTSK